MIDPILDGVPPGCPPRVSEHDTVAARDKEIERLREALEREPLDCMAAIRTACEMCDEGHALDDPSGQTECEYCGRPLEAIRNRIKTVAALKTGIKAPIMNKEQAAKRARYRSQDMAATERKAFEPIFPDISKQAFDHIQHRMALVLDQAQSIAIDEATR